MTKSPRGRPAGAWIAADIYRVSTIAMAHVLPKKGLQYTTSHQQLAAKYHQTTRTLQISSFAPLARRVVLIIIVFILLIYPAGHPLGTDGGCTHTHTHCTNPLSGPDLRYQ